MVRQTIRENLRMKSSEARLALAVTAALCALPMNGCREEPSSSTPAKLIRATYAEGEITRLCDAALATAGAQLDAIAALPQGRRDFKNTVLGIERVTADFNDTVSPLTFMGYVSTDEKLREEGSSCEEKYGQFFVTAFTRKDLYQAISGRSGSNSEQRRLHSEMRKGFENNGLSLPDGKLVQVRALKQKLAALEAEFSANLNNDQSTVAFTAAELDGLPADFLGRVKKDAEGRYVVTTKSTDYTQVMQNAKSAETRRLMLKAYLNRAASANVRLLEDAISVRQQIAGLMGYKTWADYKTSSKMAKDAATVMDFLNGLKAKLADRNRADLDQLLAFKRESDPTAAKLESWDVSYYSYQLKKRDFSLDDELIREYFPKDLVMKGMFDVYSKLLGVHFVEVVDGDVWADGVKLYRIVDAKTQETLAHFYTDFVPRPGKYGHAAAFPLISGRRVPGGYQKPVSSIVANFNPPSGGKPSLLNHSEVETLFHEFGHIMHQTLTTAPYTSLSGTSVAQDFVEAPSQMLENWVWNADILRSISGHYADPSRKLPDDLLRKMIASQDFMQGYFYTRQLVFGLLDMAYHNVNGPVDTTAVYTQVYRDVAGLEPVENDHFQASFGHLMGGYDAGYYGYLWSEVYAQDLFTRFEREGPLSEAAGHDYRKLILSPGSMRDPLDLIRDFLGREPSSDAFFRKLGI